MSSSVVLRRARRSACRSAFAITFPFASRISSFTSPLKSLPSWNQITAPSAGFSPRRVRREARRVGPPQLDVPPRRRLHREQVRRLLRRPRRSSRGPASGRRGSRSTGRGADDEVVVLHHAGRGRRTVGRFSLQRLPRLAVVGRVASRRARCRGTAGPSSSGPRGRRAGRRRCGSSSVSARPRLAEVGRLPQVRLVVVQPVVVDDDVGGAGVVRRRLDAAHRPPVGQVRDVRGHVRPTSCRRPCETWTRPSSLPAQSTPFCFGDSARAKMVQ